MTVELSMFAGDTPAINLKCVGPFTALEVRLLQELFPSGHYDGVERVGLFRHEHVWRCTVFVQDRRAYCHDVSDIIKTLRYHGFSFTI